MKSDRKLIIWFVIIVIIMLILLLTIIILIDENLRAEIFKEIAKLLAQLITIGIVGAYAKYLFDKYRDDRQHQREIFESKQREEKQNKAEEQRYFETKHKVQLEALNSLTTSYWEIKKAFHIISAHRSAKSYGEQIRNIIDYRLKLQRLHNEIKAGLYYFKSKDVDDISKNLSTMDSRLSEVVDEWKSEYLRLSQLQKKDEKTEDIKDKCVPNEIDSLTILNKIKANLFNAIHKPFENAVTPMRNELLNLVQVKNKISEKA